MAKRKIRKRLPVDIRKARWQYAERLFAQGLEIREVNKKVVAKYERALNWRTYKAMQERVLGEQPAEEIDQVAEEALVSVQPVKQVSQRLRMRLQGVVNDMNKGGIQRLTIDSAGAVSVVFTPTEQIFDLEG